MVQTLHFRIATLACLVAAAFTAQAQVFGPQAAPQAQQAPQTEPAPRAQPPDAPGGMQEPLDAELFYELLVGEMSARQGDPAMGYALMLEAARRSGDPQAYRRATQMALQTHSAQSALIAVRAWTRAEPASSDANRYLLRILVTLNRTADTAEPLRNILAAAPAHDRPSIMGALPQLYAHVSDKALAAQVVQQALQPELDDPALAPAAWVTVGRLRLAAGDQAQALQAARSAQAHGASDEGAALLALQLLKGGETQAEAIVKRYLAGKPLPEVRMTYARQLLEAQRLSDAQAQIDIAVREQPEAPDAWLIKASLLLLTNQLDKADEVLQHFIGLLATLPESRQRQNVQTQAYLMLAQIAEKDGNIPKARMWLSHIDDGSDMLGTQARYASLLARQGKLDEARALLHAVPATTPQEEQRKLQAEAQLLREAGDLQQAYAVLDKALTLDPQNNDLAYDLAMLAEKAGMAEKSELLLRSIIERAPDYHHALNALGYTLANRGEHLEEALDLIERALSIAPDDPYIIDSLGWVEFRMGQHDEALQTLRRAYSVQRDPEIAAHLGEVLWTQGQRGEALTVWREGLRADKDNETLQDTIRRLGAKP